MLKVTSPSDLDKQALHLNRRKTYLEGKEYKKAEQEFKKVLQMDPENGQVYFELRKNDIFRRL